MSIPDDIRARARGGAKVGGPYNQGNTSPVNVYKDSAGAVYWTSGMSIDCDGQPGSACNINTDPYFQAQTAFNQSNGKPLKAEELPFVVVPLKSSIWDYRNSGIGGGDLVVMAYKDKYVFGVVGDLGPSQRIGEASYAAAAALGINPNPRSGGVGSGVTYVVFPGVKVRPIESKAEAVRVGTAKLAEWLGPTGPDEEPEPPQGGEQLTAIDKMIAEAEKTIGLGEPNYIHDWYNSKFGNPDGSRNWPWCNGAVTYWAHKSGNAKAVCFSETGHYAYTVAHAEAFRSRGQWHTGTSGIRRGDIVFFDWNGSDSISAIDHVGVVTGVRADGKVDTIEGNINNVCARRLRTSFEIAGYGRPAYADGGTSEPPATGGTVKLSDAIAKTDAATRIIQAALNEEFGGVVVDGDYGPQTTAAYTRWQQSLGWPGDGVPGAHSLSELGEKYDFPVDLEGATPTPPGGTVPPPDPDPEPEPEPEPPAPVTPKVTFEHVYPGAPVNASVRIVQDALNREYGGVVVDGDFGPQTTAAYSRWQRSLGFSGVDANGTPGMTSLSRLAAKYGFTVVRGTAPGPGTPPPAADDEPAHNYTRVVYGGKTVNARTRAMLQNAVKLLTAYEWTPRLTQGSYNTGVGASAGTHDGGGVVDINTSSMSVSGMHTCVQALRKAGFAAWLRTPAQGFAYHIHAVAIGDREMSPAAKSQIRQWAVDTNGLANHGSDPYADPYPAWTQKYR